MQFPHVLALLGNLGTAEIIFIVLLILLLFGAQKIPDLARSLGKAQREFQKARQQLEDEAPPPSDETEGEKLRKAARDLGIDVSGKSDEQLRTAISEKVNPSFSAKG